MSDKTVRDEIAELTDAVHELRDREVADTLRDLRAEVEHLRAERNTHHCTGCSCMHIHYYQPLAPAPLHLYQPPIWHQPYQVTCESGFNINTIQPITATATRPVWGYTNTVGGTTDLSSGGYTVTATN